MKRHSDIVELIAKEGFEAAALETFRFQAVHLDIYRRYIELLGIKPEEVTSLDGIPFLPIEFFRSHRVYCGEGVEELVFNSSGTTGGDTSSHYVASAALYRDSYEYGFREFFGDMGEYRLVTLLPSYRSGSSLLHMIEGLRGQCTGERVLLWGVTFALLEEAMSGRDVRLPEGSIVLETGGMKGREYEISREELHRVLCEAYGVESIASEYGMCELLSQGYSFGGGVFRPCGTMRIIGRDIESPLVTGLVGERCGINVIDLSNRYSCSFLATGDCGVVYEDGSFEIYGRIEGEILRGCNMLSFND
ncbi:MAG: acyltransferase [Rikenellaceae bacterium]